MPLLRVCKHHLWRGSLTNTTAVLVLKHTRNSGILGFLFLLFFQHCRNTFSGVLPAWFWLWPCMLGSVSLAQ